MSRLDKIRHMSDKELLSFLKKFKEEKSNCIRCAKNGTKCNPYTGEDCKEGMKEYFKEDGDL